MMILVGQRKMSGKYLQRFINQLKVKTYIQTSLLRASLSWLAHIQRSTRNAGWWCAKWRMSEYCWAGFVECILCVCSMHAGLVEKVQPQIIWSDTIIFVYVKRAHTCWCIDLTRFSVKINTDSLARCHIYRFLLHLVFDAFTLMWNEKRFDIRLLAKVSAIAR